MTLPDGAPGNERLRSARRARPSPVHPGEPMSRHELADAVNAHLWRVTGRRYALDAHVIARYERGAVRWPGRDYRAALRVVLDVETDAELGFRPTRRGRAVADLPIGARAPRTVGRPEIMAVRSATAAFAASDNTLGGRTVSTAGLAQLRALAAWCELPGTADDRAELVEAVGNLAGVVAFAALDAGDGAAATRCSRFALRCAEDAGSWRLRSTVLTDLARFSEQTGDLDGARSFADHALVRADRLTPTGRAVAHMVRARVLARLNESSAAADDIAAADEGMSTSDPSNDPAWLCYYDGAEHQGSTGRAFAVLGDIASATARLRSAVQLSTTSYPRSRTFSRIRLATLLAGAGELGAALEDGEQALRDAATLRSDRVDDELRRLGATLRRTGTRAARGLADEIGARAG